MALNGTALGARSIRKGTRLRSSLSPRARAGHETLRGSRPALSAFLGAGQPSETACAGEESARSGTRIGGSVIPTRDLAAPGYGAGTV